MVFFKVESMTTATTEYFIGEDESPNDFPGKWYWIAIPWVWPVDHITEATLPNGELIDAPYTWCCHTFGIPQAPNHRIQRKWRRSGHTTYHFREEKHRDWFLLRWVS